MSIKNNNTIPPVSLEDVGGWLAEHGMAIDAHLLAVVYYTLSRLLGEGSGDRANLHNLTTPLAALGTRPFRRNGVEEAALLPQIEPTAWPFEVSVKGWPAGGTALNRLGMTVGGLDRLWRRAKVDDDLHALLPVGVVCAFFPPPLWRMVAQVIEWGPAETSYRLRRFLMAEASRELAPTRARRSGGTVSKHTIRNRYMLMRRLMNVLVELRGAGWCLPGQDRPSEHLEEWKALPLPIDLDQLDAQDANTDRSAPPMRVVRLALSELFDELERRQRTEAGRRGMLKVYRDTLLLSLLVVLGARVGDIHGIRPCDYDPQRKGRDGQRGPAIRLRVKKLRGAERWKPIPAEVAHVLEGWLAFTGLDRPEYRERVIWIAEWASERSVGQPGPESPDGTLKQAVAGDGRGGRRALLPKDDDPSNGYSAHTLRHLAEQLAKRFGHGWLTEHPEQVGRISDRVFADALLDHAWGASDVNGYSDLERDREYLAGLAAAGVWDLVRGDPGARSAPDWDRILRAQHRVAESQAVVDEYLRRVEALKAERAKLMDDTSDPDLDGLDLELLVRGIYRDQRAMARINASLDQAVEELAAARDDQRDTRDELARSRSLRVAVPDTVADADFEALLGRPPSVADQSPKEEHREPVRDWITPKEAAWAWSKSEPQVRNWFRGRGRPPWDATQVVQEISPRKRRLLIDRLDRAAIPPSVMKRIHTLLCQPPTRS
jgi:integrase